MNEALGIKLKHLTLNLSTKCNQTCEFCFAHHRVFSPNELMPLEIAKKATDLYFKNRCHDYKAYSIMLFGGEPLLNFEIIPQYITWLRSEYKNFMCDINLFTNGLLLNKKMIDYFISQNVNIHITFDTNYYNYSLGKNTTKEAHQHVLSVIKTILSINKYRVIPIYMINNSNPQNLEVFGAEMNKIGVKSIFIVKELFNKWTKNDIQLILKLSYSIRENYGIKVILGPEATFSCTDCYPQNIMVYPDGSIFDNCLTFGCALFKQGFVSKNDLIDAFYIGNVNTENQILTLNTLKKREMTHKKYSDIVNTSCQTTYADTSAFKALWID